MLEFFQVPTVVTASGDWESIEQLPGPVRTVSGEQSSDSKKPHAGTYLKVHMVLVWISLFHLFVNESLVSSGFIMVQLKQILCSPPDL